MPSSLATGTLLNQRYRLVGEAGQGHFGQTYLARDQQQMNALCIVREFDPAITDPKTLQKLWERFQDQVRPLYALQHPQLPGFYRLFIQDHKFYWVREYIDGLSFANLLTERRAQGKRFTESEMLQLLEQVLPALHYLHGQGMTHRNLAPDSLILRQRDRQPVLVEFGLVREIVAQLHLHPLSPQDARGRWGYAPPEQLAGRAQPASDLFSLAVTVVVLLTGQTPENLYNPAAASCDWESQVDIQPTFRRLLQQMLLPDPQRRPPSASAVLQQLQPWLPSQTWVGMAAAPPTEPASPVRESEPAAIAKSGARELVASMAVGAGLLILLGAIGWRVFATRTTSTPTTDPEPSPAAEMAPAPTESPLPTDAPTPTDAPPPAAPAVDPAAVRDRLQQLELDGGFFNSLVDEVFYAKYPELREPTTGDATQQAARQTEWMQLGNALLDKIATLQPATRQKLGTYNREDYNAWLARLGETGANSATLDRLADARFYQLFPELQGQTLNPRTFGQIWYALAEEALPQAQQTAPTPTPSPSAAPASPQQSSL